MKYPHLLGIVAHYDMLESEAKEFFGEEEHTGQFEETLSCPNHGLLGAQGDRQKAAWDKLKERNKFCCECGSALLVGEQEVVYPGHWQNQLRLLLEDADERAKVLTRLQEAQE